MRSCKSVCDLFSLFCFNYLHQLIPILPSEYSRSSGDGFRTEEVAGKNRPGSTRQGATIADELARYLSLTTRDVISDAASEFRTAA
jgi:hypothetical protein